MRNFDDTNFEYKGLNVAKSMSKLEAINLLKKTDLVESGYYYEKIWEKYDAIKDCKINNIVVGFNNNDDRFVQMCILEKDAFSIFEGMAIVGEILEVSKGTLYIPKEKDSIIETLERKLKEADLQGFKIEIIVGKIDSRELGEEILVHHVETAAAISAMFNLGEQFVQTKIIAVDGLVEKPDISEVTIDSNIKEIIDNIAGGTKGNIKAIVLGGKTGKCITEEDAETEKFLGFGVNEINVLSSESCIVDFAKQGIAKVYENTCGKCTFCREGAYQLSQILSDAVEGRGKSEDIELMEEIADEMAEETNCSFGLTASEFVRTSLKLFKSEYETHIKRKNCPTGYCKAFSIIAIKGDLCDSCGECMDVCEYDAIEGKKNYIHMIDEFECTKCGKCIEVCPNNAIVKIAANKSVGPNKLTPVGKWKKR
jgi:NADH:ubiquinone oxidoreductase subunit F (NADH-binding)/NAD-dependent dihydropyrimidine dehydrogenase PreA subunit